MTKTIITLLITFYSVLRLITIGTFYYDDAMRLPLPVVVVAAVSAVLMLLVAGRCFLFQLSGKNLRFALLIGAAAAAVNMALVLVDQPGTLTNSELLITGTVFDILVFLGSCSIKIRDTRGKTGRTPFSRAASSQEK